MLIALEPRIMFDGAALATGAEVLQDTTTQEQIEISGIDGYTPTDSTNNDSSSDDALWSSGLSLNAPSDRKEIVFVDTSVDDFQTLVAGIDPNAEVILLDSTRDGIEQIAEILGERTDINAVHIISHGDSGELRLGTGVLNLASMQGVYADELATINQALTEEADFLIYGCNFGEGEAGQGAATILAKLTGADVAASNDLTGAEALGGDWDLEVQTGTIESAGIVDEQAQEGFAGVLDITTGLVGHWTFDANANDSSAENNHGTLLGAAIDTTPATNKIGGGKLSLDGADDYVELGSHVADYAGLTEGTFAAWVKLSGSGTQTILSIGDSGNINAQANFLIDSGQFEARFGDGTGISFRVTTTATVNDDAWHHVAFTVESGGNAVYIDGVAAAVSYTTGDSSSPTFLDDVPGENDVEIGTRPFLSTHLNDYSGLIDDTRIYNRALSAADIAELANSAPELDNAGTMTLLDIAEDNTTSTGDTVAVIIDSDGGDRITDVDSGAVEGLAVIGVDDTNGTWQYNAGSGFMAFGAVTNTNAVLLDTTSLIRFVPDANYTGTAGTITFRAWDQTSGSDGQTGVDVSTNGTPTAFSTDTETATLAVTAVNDAPTFLPLGDGIATTSIGGNARAHSVVVQPDGKILVAGESGSGLTHFTLTRYNSDGTLDTSFGDGDGIVTTVIGVFSKASGMTLQVDGKILVTGESLIGSSIDTVLARYDSDGTLDMSFGGGDGIVTTGVAASSSIDRGRSVTVQTIGMENKILVAGESIVSGNIFDFALTRYTENGILDTTFGGGDGIVTTDIVSSEFGHSVTVQTDGKILVGGESSNGSGIFSFALTRYDSDGNLDVSFDGDGKLTTDFGVNDDSGYSVIVQADNKILVAGDSFDGSDTDFALVRYDPDGMLDTSFSMDGKLTTDFGGNNDSGRSVTLQADGKILVAGESFNGSDNDFALVRYDPDGMLDTSFDMDGKLTTDFGENDDFAKSVTLQADGKILVAGASGNGSNDAFVLVRYNVDGTLDTSFGPASTTLDGAPTFTEGGPAVVLDADVDVRDSELDALNGGFGNYSGASLTLVRNGGVNTDDVFTFSDGNGITLSGGNLIKNTKIIATFDTTTTSGELVITFTDANIPEIPTSADVDNILRQITYANSSDTPPASAQIGWTFSDGNTGSQGSGSALNATGSTTVTITAVNDAATVATNTGSTVIEGGSVIITNAMLNEGDPDDSGAGITYRVVNDYNNGTLLVGGVAMKRNDTFTQADIDAGIVVYKHTGAEDPFEIIRLGIVDGSEDGAGETTFNFNISVTAANDAPIAADDPAGTVTNLVADPDTIGFWRLGESSGTTAIDESGNNNGTYNNVTLGATGVAGGDTAGDFNGSNAHVDLGTLDVAGSGITMAAWINADTFGTSDGRIFGKSDGVLNQDHTWMLSVLDIGPNVFLRFRLSAGNYTEALIASGPSLSTGQWYHVAATYDEATGVMALYVNGEQIEFGEHSVGGAVDQDPTRSVWIGGNPAGLNFFDGRIDEAVIMQRGMSASEIVALAELAPPDYSVTEDGSLSVNATTGVLQNDSDVEGDALTVTQINGSAPNVGTQIPLASGALVTLNTDGSFDYDPNGQFETLGAAQTATDTFAYTVSDGSGTDTATAEITITGVNDVPVATGNTVVAQEDVPLVIGPSAFTFTDVEGDSLTSVTIAGLTLNGGTLTHTGGTVPVTNGMTVTAADLTDLTFTSALNDSTTSSFTYTVNDAGLGVTSATMTITVNAVNDAPVATDDPGDFNTILSNLNPLSSWRFDEASGSSSGDLGSSNNAGTYNNVTLGQMGALNGDANTAGYFDGSTSYVEIAHDPSYLLDNGTVQVWFNTDSIGTYQTLVSKDSNGFDTGGHFLLNLEPSGQLNARIQSTSGHNTVTSIGSVTAGSWHHAAMTFGSNGMVLYLDGQEVATNAYTGGLGTTSGGSGNFEPLVIGAGTWSSGNLVSTPLIDFFGGSLDEAAIFGSQLNAAAIQDLYAAGLQDYTIAEDSTLNIAAAQGVLSNDYDAEGDSLTAALVTGPSNAASFSLNADGSFMYTPLANFNGTDTFTYQVSDGNGGTDTATVTITVTAGNDVPMASNLNAAESYTEDTVLNLTDIVVTDVDSTTVTATFTLSDVGAGTLNTATSGAVTSTFIGGVWRASGAIADVNTLLAGVNFMPTLNYNSAFTIATSVDDGIAAAVTGSKAMTGTAVNDVPVNTIPGPLVVVQNTPLALSGVSINDVDGNLSTVQVSVTHGTVTVSLSGGTSISSGTNGTSTVTLSGTQAAINATLASLSYQGALNYTGPDTLTVTSTDSISATDVDMVAITVTSTNNAPVITSNGGGVGGSLSLAENQMGVTTLTAMDGDGDPLTYSIVGGVDAARFIIDPSTGVLQFLAPTDFETPTDVGSNNVYDVQVQVSDGQGGIDTQSLAIRVVDVLEGMAPLPPPPAPTPDPPPEPEPDSLSPPQGLEGFSIDRGDTEWIGRGPEEEASLRDRQDISKVLNLPFLPSASWGTTTDQIRAYYADPLDLIKNELSADVLRQLNQFSEELGRTMEEEVVDRTWFHHAVNGTGLALSAGLAAWLVRGGALLTWFLTSLPAWRHFDPVPILGMDKKDKETWTRRAKEVAQLEAHEHQGLEQILQTKTEAGSKATS